jgi:oligogalacturonide lyase
VSCACDNSVLYAAIQQDYSRNPLPAVIPPTRLVAIPTDGSGKIQVINEQRYTLPYDDPRDGHIGHITHINASPAQPNLFTFAHEGTQALVDTRIWCCDARTGIIYMPRPRRAPKKRTIHEWWYPDGVTIGFHGSIGEDADVKYIFGRFHYDGLDQFNHVSPCNTGMMHANDKQIVIGDGGDYGDAQGYIIGYWWEGEDYSAPRILCRHGASVSEGHSYPEPRVSPDGKYTVFTSDVSGVSQVYMVAMPQTKEEFEKLPPVRHVESAKPPASPAPSDN